MSSLLKGLNTGLMLHEENFVALAIKIKTDKDKVELFYMQAPVLKDFFMLLQNRLFLSFQRAGLALDELKAEIENISKELTNHIPDIEMNDLQQPDQGLRVISLSASFEEESFNILLSLQNGQMSHIKVSDSQIMFIIMALGQALNNFKNQEFSHYLSTAIDFLPLYDVIFQPDGTLDYNQYQFDSWKADLFNNCFLIIYRTETSAGPELSCGGVFKTNASTGTPDLDNMARAFCSLSKNLQPYHPLITDIYTQPLHLEKKIIPSLNDALQPLAEFLNSIKSIK